MASEVVPFNPGKLPAHLRRDEPSDVAKNLMGSGGGGKRVSIKGGFFRLLDNGKEIASIEERYLDIVIINAAPKVGRVWYGVKYDAESTAAPKCWSGDGDKPDASIEEPQAKRCADCEQNIKGSGEGDSRACRYQQRIALVLADDINEKSDVMQLTVPAASLFGKAEGDKRPLQEYARWLVAQKASPELLVTRVRFDSSSESPKLFFKPMRWLEQDEFDAVTALSTSDEAIKAITMTLAQRDGTPASTAADEGVTGKPPVKAKAKPAADAEPPASPPKKKAAAPAPAPADDENEDPPAPPPKKKPAPPPADDENEDPPAPPPKKKAAAPAPADEDDEPPAPPAKRKGAEAPVSGAKKSAAELVNDWGDD